MIVSLSPALIRIKPPRDKVFQMPYPEKAPGPIQFEPKPHPRPGNPSNPLKELPPLPWKAMIRFGGQQKLAQNARSYDNYIKYTPYNTPCPLATWRAIATSKAVTFHNKNAEILQKYIDDTGEYYKDIPWVKYKKPLGQEPYIVFDTETTGTQSYDRIVQLAASKINGNHTVSQAEGLNTLVNPGTDGEGNPFKIKAGATEVHGIRDEDVVGKPTIEDLLPDFRNKLVKRNGLVVAYNAKFDIGFINTAIERWNRRRGNAFLRPLEPALVLDPYILIQRIHPFVSLRKRLGDHYEILMGRPLENMHDAQADVDATVDVLKYTLKYLQKHTIPLKWAKALESRLLQEGVIQPETEPAQKAALIARLVRENRALLEQKLPVTESETLLITDILKFQHGAPVDHEGESGLPKLDITLNLFGWDGTKVWENKSDTMDPEVVSEVRNERDTENRAHLKERFMNSKALQSEFDTLTALRDILVPQAQGTSQAVFERMNLSGQMLSNLSNRFADAVLTKTLPQNNAEWQKWESEILESLTTFVDNKLKTKPVQQEVRQSLYAGLKPLAGDLVKHMQQLQQQLGERFFYTSVPVDPDKPLIDPTVLEMPVADNPKKTRLT